MHLLLRQLTQDHRLFLRDALREARAKAHRDAEGFDGIIFALERLKTLLGAPGPGLGSASDAMAGVASSSPLAEEIPRSWREYHTPFRTLYGQVNVARNHAFHEGALARHLAGDAIVLALTLEDALMFDAHVVGDYMIRQPICAQMWQPLSFVRQTMLSNSFSYLPVNRRLDGGFDWGFVCDTSLAAFTRTPDRRNRLGMTLQDAIAKGLVVPDAHICTADTAILEALEQTNGQPILVTSKGEGSLIGLATAFDLL